MQVSIQFGIGALDRSCQALCLGSFDRLARGESKRGVMCAQRELCDSRDGASSPEFVPATAAELFWSIGQRFVCEHRRHDPKGGELCLATPKPWETAVEGGLSTDVQIVCSSLV